MRGTVAVPATVAASLTLTLDVRRAFAHGFGERYDLPVPLWLWLVGASMAVTISFAGVGIFLRAPGAGNYPRVNLLRWRVARLLAHRRVCGVTKLAAVIILVLVVVAGLFGTQNPMRNLAPVTVWVLWWVGFAFLSALIGNLWALVNPWKSLFEWGEKTLGPLSLNRPYPERLGVWPAVAGFLVFAWIDLVFTGRAEPAWLALLVVHYSLVTWVGMAVFGVSAWLRYADPFAVAFDILARFAPTEVRVTDTAVCAGCPECQRSADRECVNCYGCFATADDSQRELNLRWFAVGLARGGPIPVSMVVFVVVLLSTVTFDGLAATPAWGRIEDALFGTLPALGGARVTAISTAGLLVVPTLFLGLYGLFARWIAAAGASTEVGRISRAFVLSLVPIAIGYHLAHYLTYLLIQGQLIVPLASDPFGSGWNLFSTADFRPDIGVVGARFAW